MQGEITFKGGLQDIIGAFLDFQRLLGFLQESLENIQYTVLVKIFGMIL